MKIVVCIKQVPDIFSAVVSKIDLGAEEAEALSIAMGE